LGARCQ